MQVHDAFFACLTSRSSPRFSEARAFTQRTPIVSSYIKSWLLDIFLFLETPHAPPIKYFPCVILVLRQIVASQGVGDSVAFCWPPVRPSFVLNTASLNVTRSSSRTPQRQNAVCKHIGSGSCVLLLLLLLSRAVRDKCGTYEIVIR